ncbi:hypothetical protein JZ751_027417 [Albula glossodonta]|uniref:Uncharacterized protein n=1 Tax=Albula glossodonta TaxID=121402 RepID=A0A8T2ND71_9TELE|nr:hypothetical protein JZ751_027417 [Albula glossodonta]
MPKQKDTHDHLRNQGPDGKNMNTFEKDLNRGTNSKKQHESQDGNTTGHLSSENTSNKSSTCAIL